MAFLSGQVLSGWWQPQSCHCQVNSPAWEGRSKSDVGIDNKQFLGQLSGKKNKTKTETKHFDTTEKGIKDYLSACIQDA